MDNSSYFIENKALFGYYPSQLDVNELESCNVLYFVDLTFDTEKRIKKYKTSKNYINFPIKDRKYPYDTEKYCIFIYTLIHIINNLKNNEKIYIHCRAGHSRSSMVVSTLLKIINNLSIDEAIDKTKEYHNKRKNLKQKWIKMEHQTSTQKKYLYNIFSNTYFFKAYKEKNPTFGFSTYSLHRIHIPQIGIFYNCEIAFNALLHKENQNYVRKQLTTKSVYESRKLLHSLNKPVQIKQKEQIMNYILALKLEQHPVIKEKLLSSGFQKLIYTNKYDLCFGIGASNNGLNILGKLLMKIRNNYYKDKIFLL